VGALFQLHGSISGRSHSNRWSHLIHWSRSCRRSTSRNPTIHSTQDSTSRPTFRSCLTSRYHCDRSTLRCRGPDRSCHRPTAGRCWRNSQCLGRPDCRDRCGSASCFPIAANFQSRCCPSYRGSRSSRCVPTFRPTPSRCPNCLTSHSSYLC